MTFKCSRLYAQMTLPDHRSYTKVADGRKDLLSHPALLIHWGRLYIFDYDYNGGILYMSIYQLAFEIDQDL